MQLKAFKVEMYRPILDSEWVAVDDITAIVGKNESGKTGLLKALHKFKPFKPEPYSIDREWPRGHRKDRSQDAVVVRTRFFFNDEEIRSILDVFPGEARPMGVEIARTYKGDYRYRLLPQEFPTQATTDYVVAQITERLRPGTDTSAEFQKAMIDVQSQAVKCVKQSGLSSFPGRVAERHGFIPCPEKEIAPGRHPRGYGHWS